MTSLFVILFTKFHFKSLHNRVLSKMIRNNTMTS